SISALTSIDPAKAREMCILLAEFLRMTLGLGEKSNILLAEEMALLDRFLAIEKVRFGPRLKLEEDIQEQSKPMLVLPLLLQPLGENAVIHGIANLPAGGSIRLVAHCHDGRLSIIVENTFDPESRPPTSTVFRAGSFVFYDLGFFSSLPALTCHVLTGCIIWAGMPSVA
ncbi:MAG: hypothetical protein E6K45_13145, partial [Gammaproteobacteria bacterium]